MWLKQLVAFASPSHRSHPELFIPPSSVYFLPRQAEVLLGAAILLLTSAIVYAMWSGPRGRRQGQLERFMLEF